MVCSYTYTVGTGRSTSYPHIEWIWILGEAAQRPDSQPISKYPRGDASIKEEHLHAHDTPAQVVRGNHLERPHGLHGNG